VRLRGAKEMLRPDPVDWLFKHCFVEATKVAPAESSCVSVKNGRPFGRWLAGNRVGSPPLLDGKLLVPLQVQAGSSKDGAGCGTKLGRGNACMLKGKTPECMAARQIGDPCV
jgi:hypothetical protein